MIAKMITRLSTVEPRLRSLLAQRLALALALALLSSPVMAYAQTVTGGASPQTMINNVCTFILGPFGETIAVLGIIGIGFLFMFGASYLGETLTGGG